MAIDRDALKKQLADQKARRDGTFVQYIKKDETRNLRIVEFVDQDGNNQFSRTVVHFRSADGKKTFIDRKRTFGAACAATRMDEIASEAGEPSPFQRRQTQYYANAVDLNKTPHKMQMFALPATVWEIIATMLVSEEWENVLEPESGHPFVITRSGAGLDTTYTCTVGRKSFPVSEELLKQVKDPYSAVGDSGIEGQCRELGVKIEDIFPDGVDGMEMVEPITFGQEEAKEEEKPAKAPAKTTAAKPAAQKAAPAPAATPAKATPAKATPLKKQPEPEPEPEEATLEVGSRVSAEVEGVAQEGEVTAIEGETANVKFDFDAESEYEVPISDLALVVEEEPDPEPLPVVKKTTATAKDTAKAAAAKMGTKKG